MTIATPPSREAWDRLNGRAKEAHDRMNEWGFHATTEIAQYRNATEDYAQAMARELEHTHQKPVEKTAAILRLLGSQNPLTGKPHSASSAETLVESEPGYAAFLAAYRQAVVDRIRAEGEQRRQVMLVELCICRMRQAEISLPAGEALDR
jgi:predicted trehalose synthase